MKGVDTIFYLDLRKEIFEISWFPEKLPNKFQVVQDIVAFEVRVECANYESALLTIRTIAQELVLNQTRKSHLILLNGNKSSRSKIRSYKGLFPYQGEIKKGDYYELEVEAEKSMTYFIGIAQTTENNIKESLDLASDYVRSFFLLQTKETEIVPEQVLEDLQETFFPHKTSLTFDYMSVVPRIVKQGLTILRFSKSMRDDFVSIIIFANKHVSEDIGLEIRNFV